MDRIKAFPFWRKQYLFHTKATSNCTLLRLYQPYKPIAKLNWRLWKFFSVYQLLFTFKIKENSPLSQLINKLIGQNTEYIWAINRGTKSIYQKTTGLVVSKELSSEVVHPKNFFFKWGNSTLAIESIKNEIDVIVELQNKSFAPQIIYFEINEKEAFYKTQIIHGTKYVFLEINNDIINLIKEIQHTRPLHSKNHCKSSVLLTSFQHGDFCPWNLIKEDTTNIIKAIDWEFCGIYPNGFDLLYYIFSIEFQIKKNSTPENILNKNYSILNDYYNDIGIKDWKPYLEEFAEICSKRYDNTEEGNDFLRLLNYCRA